MAFLLMLLMQPPAANYRGLAAVDETTAWVGGANGSVARTTDGGKTWHAKNPPGGGKLDFRDVEAFGANVVYAMAAGPGEASQIWKTTDGGTTWAKQFTMPDAKGFLDAIAFWDATNGVAIGDPVDGRFQIVRTTDGKSWTVERGPLAIAGESCFAASGTCLIAHGKQDLWLVTGGAPNVSRILHSADRGKTWTMKESAIVAAHASAGLFGIHRHGDTVIAVGGDYKTPTGTAKTAAVSRDAGATWTVIDGPLPFCSAVCHTTIGWLAAGPTGTFQSTDGKSWSRYDTVCRHAIAVAADGSVWACGEQGRAERVFQPSQRK
jgi:photosystem II stability/assembly factor-like uncharacterized protein